jgi:hypothetical protein
MLYNIRGIDMPRGPSGRIVLEIDPLMKNQLYVVLAKNNLTLKEWFIRQCDQYLITYNQPDLFSKAAAESSISYEGKNK